MAYLDVIMRLAGVVVIGIGSRGGGVEFRAGRRTPQLVERPCAAAERAFSTPFRPSGQYINYNSEKMRILEEFHFRLIS